MSKDKDMLISLSKKIDYLYKQEKLREERRQRKRGKEITSSAGIEEVFKFYKLFIKEDARLSGSSRSAISGCLKEFGRAKMFGVMEKKSRDKWFMDNNAWRGATWFFGNKARFQRWIEQGIAPIKKFPYYNGIPMSRDGRMIYNDYNGTWQPFSGDKSQIEWREE